MNLRGLKMKTLKELKERRDFTESAYLRSYRNLGKNTHVQFARNTYFVNKSRFEVAEAAYNERQIKDQQQTKLTCLSVALIVIIIIGIIFYV